MAQAGGEQRALVGFELALQRGVDAAEHVLRHDVRQEPESSTIDAEQRYAVTGDEAGGVKQRAIAADCNHEVGAPPSSPSGTRRSAGPEPAMASPITCRVADEHLDLPGRQMRQQGVRGLRDARVHESADQRARADGEGHPPDRSRTARGLLDGRLGRL